LCKNVVKVAEEFNR